LVTNQQTEKQSCKLCLARGGVFSGCLWNRWRERGFTTYQLDNVITTNANQNAGNNASFLEFSSAKVIDRGQTFDLTNYSLNIISELSKQNRNILIIVTSDKNSCKENAAKENAVDRSTNTDNLELASSIYNNTNNVLKLWLHVSEGNKTMSLLSNMMENSFPRFDATCIDELGSPEVVVGAVNQCSGFAPIIDSENKILTSSKETKLTFRFIQDVSRGAISGVDIIEDVYTRKLICLKDDKIVETSPQSSPFIQYAKVLDKFSSKIISLEYISGYPGINYNTIVTPSTPSKVKMRNSSPLHATTEYEMKYPMAVKSNPTNPLLLEYTINWIGQGYLISTITNTKAPFQGSPFFEQGIISAIDHLRNNTDYISQEKARLQGLDEIITKTGPVLDLLEGNPGVKVIAQLMNILDIWQSELQKRIGAEESYFYPVRCRKYNKF
jgi:hypothetical protein